MFTFVGHDNWISDLLFHSNGKYLISASDDKSIRIWDLSNGRCFKKMPDLHTHFITSIDLK